MKNDRDREWTFNWGLKADRVKISGKRRTKNLKILIRKRAEWNK